MPIGAQRGGAGQIGEQAGGVDLGDALGGVTGVDHWGDAVAVAQIVDGVGYLVVVELQVLFEGAQGNGGKYLQKQSLREQAIEYLFYGEDRASLGGLFPIIAPKRALQIFVKDCRVGVIIIFVPRKITKEAIGVQDPGRLPCLFQLLVRVVIFVHVCGKIRLIGKCTVAGLKVIGGW